MKTTVRAALYLALTFLGGSAVGIFGYRLYTGADVSADVRTNRAAEYRRAYLQEMDSRLKLDSEQKQRLTQILDQTESQFRQLNERHRPEYRAIHDAQVEQISSILTAGQRTEYAKLRVEREERRKKRGPGPY